MAAAVWWAVKWKMKSSQHLGSLPPLCPLLVARTPAVLRTPMHASVSSTPTTLDGQFFKDFVFRLPFVGAVGWAPPCFGLMQTVDGWKTILWRWGARGCPLSSLSSSLGLGADGIEHADRECHRNPLPHWMVNLTKTLSFASPLLVLVVLLRVCLLLIVCVWKVVSLGVEVECVSFISFLFASPIAARQAGPSSVVAGARVPSKCAVVRSLPVSKGGCSVRLEGGK